MAPPIFDNEGSKGATGRSQPPGLDSELLDRLEQALRLAAEAADVPMVAVALTVDQRLHWVVPEGYPTPASDHWPQLDLAGLQAEQRRDWQEAQGPSSPPEPMEGWLWPLTAGSPEPIGALLAGWPVGKEGARRPTVQASLKATRDLIADQVALRGLGRSADLLPATILRLFEIGYRQAVEGILVADLETRRIVDGNPAACRMLGYSPEDLQGMPVRQLHPADAMPKVEAIFEAPQATEREEAVHIPFQRPDGSVLISLLNAAPIRLNGRTLLVGFFSDDTERREAQRALRRNELRFRALFEENTVVMLLIDPKDGAIVDANEAAAAFYGWSRQQLRAMTIHEINMDSDVSVDGDMQAASRQTKERFRFRHRRADGSICSVEVHSGPVRIDDQKLLFSSVIDVSDREEARRKLHHRQQLYRQTLDALPARLAVLTPEATIAKTNRQWRNFEQRWRPETPIEVGDNYLEALPSSGPVHRALSAIFRDQADSRRLEYRFDRCHPPMWFDLQISRFGPADRRRLLVVHRDITSRKRAETRLEQREKEYRLLVEHQQDLVVKVDPEGRFQFVSPSYCALFGQTQEQLLGSKFMPLIHEEDRQATAEAMEALYEPPHTAHMVQRAMTSKGWRWLEWIDSAVVDEHGEVQAIIGVGRDITDQKEATEQLRRSERKFRALFEAAPVGVALLGEGGDLRDANPALCRLLGYRRSRLRGSTLQQFLHPDDRGAWVEQAGGIGDVSGREARFRRSNGQVVWGDLRASTIPDDQEAPSGTIVIIKDITDTVEHQRQLETAVAEKDTLLKEIHHRVKNNLQVVCSLLEIQHRTPTDTPADIDAPLDESVARIRSMALIHEQLYQSDTLSEIDFLDYARSLAGFLTRSLGSGPVRLDIRGDSLLLEVDTAVPLGLLLNELITNAIEHGRSEDDTLEVMVTLERKDTQARLTVCDAGPGLPESFDLPTVDSMGLTLVRRLAGQLGGTLRTFNDGGACFRVDFPVEATDS